MASLVRFINNPIRFILPVPQKKLLTSSRLIVSTLSFLMKTCPGMPGTQFLTWVATHYPEVPRIVLTGHATGSTAMRAINEAKVYKFFSKPCDILELAVAIRDALEAKEVLNQ